MRVTKNKKLSDPSHPEFGRCINFCLCASCKSAAGSRDLIRVGFNSFGWLLSELTEAVGTSEHELSIPTHGKMGKFHQHNVEQNKPDSKKYTLLMQNI